MTPPCFQESPQPRIGERNLPATRHFITWNSRREPSDLVHSLDGRRINIRGMCCSGPRFKTITAGCTETRSVIVLVPQRRGRKTRRFDQSRSATENLAFTLPHRYPRNPLARGRQLFPSPGKHAPHAVSTRSMPMSTCGPQLGAGSVEPNATFFVCTVSCHEPTREFYTQGSR